MTGDTEIAYQTPVLFGGLTTLTDSFSNMPLLDPNNRPDLPGGWLVFLLILAFIWGITWMVFLPTVGVLYLAGWLK